MSTSAERAYRQIRENIISGLYPAKAHLREAQLANELQLSRTPIREALRRLTSEGILNASPKFGVFVPSWGVEKVEQLYDLRATLESSCAELAASRMTHAQYAELDALATRMEEAVDSNAPDMMDRLTLLNRQFHEQIMTISGNDQLREMTLSAIAQLPILHRSFHRYEPEQWQRSMRHHRELLDAFYVRDAHWAAAMMRAHILAGKYQLRLARRDGFDDRSAQPQSLASADDRNSITEGDTGCPDSE